jgi:hypothetical protein
MAVSPIGLRGMASTPKRNVTIRWAGEGTSIAVLEAPAVVASLDDVAMMGQTIQHGGGHPSVAEYLRPIGKSQIGGDQQRRVFIQFADQVEQQLAPRLAERQVPSSGYSNGYAVGTLASLAPSSSMAMRS